MKQRKKKLFNADWLLIFKSYSFLIFVLLLAAYLGLIPYQITIFPFYDIVGHFFLLGLLSYFLNRALNRRTTKVFGCNIPLGLLLVSCFIVIEESSQAFFATRNFSLLDLLFGMLGVYVFYLIDNRSRKK